MLRTALDTVSYIGIVMRDFKLKGMPMEVLTLYCFIFVYRIGKFLCKEYKFWVLTYRSYHIFGVETTGLIIVNQNEKQLIRAQGAKMI